MKIFSDYMECSHIIKKNENLKGMRNMASIYFPIEPFVKFWTDALDSGCRAKLRVNILNGHK